MIVESRDAPYATLVVDTKGFACAPFDHKFVADCLREIPKVFRRTVMQKYNDSIRRESRDAANSWLLNISHISNDSSVHPQSTVVSIREQACALARACSQSMRQCDSPDLAHAKAVRILGKAGFSFSKNTTALGAIKRVSCEKWWNRKLLRAHRQLLERFSIELNKVCLQRQIYASNDSVRQCQHRAQKTTALLQTLEAVNDLGDRISLIEIREHSLANPANRRAELMARMSGCESFAIANNDIGYFVTLTCPSSMHATLSVSGKPNPKFDQTTPKLAHEYLNSVWRKVRSKWKRDYINAYGFRIVEPQHDGTPHWHLLLFVPACRSDEALEIIKIYALQKNPEEKGAKEHRTKIVKIDYDRGTATGYVAKYVSKNIDGAYLDGDTSGIPSDDAALRVTTWAKTWGIRQFQQFGGPPVSVWRELRKAKPDSAEGILQVAAAQADIADWHGYMDTMGGVGVTRKNLPIRLVKAWSDKPGRYGDPAGYQTLGLCSEESRIVTRHTTWEIQEKVLAP